MSARDSESGSSTYKGGSGRAGGLGNGGLGGGMGGGGNWGGGMGGGAARNGGIGNRTGLATGTVMKGIPGRDGLTFSGRPGGFAAQPGAWGLQNMPAVSQAPMNRPAVPGLLGPAAPVPAAAIPPYVPQLPNMWYPPAQVPQNPLVDVQPDLPPLDDVPGVPAPPSTAPDWNPKLLKAYKSPYGPEMVGQWGSGVKGRWHDNFGTQNPGYDRGYMGRR